MRENKRVLMGKPHRGFVIYRAGLPSVVRLSCLWNMRESNATGVALSLSTRIFVCQMSYTNIQIGKKRNTYSVAFASLAP